mmetsp:Transcript_30635/g.64814  ORF Transcript_30635/g.64814 Transcript_30635/m.64814 type:complete len:139 (-) Transcript_30635:1076-1492(-)
MIAMQFVMLTIVMALAWISLNILFRNEPKLVAMGLFGCTHKTVAMGVPLINAIYEDNPLVGLYTLPLLIWHPMQLVLGTAVAPRVAAYVKKREMELMQNQEQQEDDKDVGKPHPDEDSQLMESGAVANANESAARSGS